MTNLLLLVLAITFVLWVLEALLALTHPTQENDKAAIDSMMRSVYFHMADSCFPYDSSGYFTPVTVEGFDDLTAYCSFSFRESWAECDKPSASTSPDATRLLALGDSFTEAVGVHFKDTWPERLESLLNENSQGKVETINCGMASLNIDEIVDRYMEKNERHRAHVVVYALTLNDIFIDHEAEILTARFDGYGGAKGVEQNDSITKELAERSALARLFMQRYQAGQVTDAMLFLYRAAYTSPQSEALAHLLDKISALNQAVHENGGRLLVAVWPLFYKLDNYPFAEIHTLLGNELEMRGIQALDLLQLFSGKKAESFHAHPMDSHPNPAAHAMSAKAMAEKLRSLGWVPRQAQ